MRGNRYSTGSSTVRMRHPPPRFSWLTIIASVVVLPEPVAPVRITSPSRRLARRLASGGGNPAQSKSGIASGIRRKQAPSC